MQLLSYAFYGDADTKVSANLRVRSSHVSTIGVIKKCCKNVAEKKGLASLLIYRRLLLACTRIRQIQLPTQCKSRCRQAVKKERQTAWAAARKK